MCNYWQNAVELLLFFLFRLSLFLSHLYWKKVKLCCKSFIFFYISEIDALRYSRQTDALTEWFQNVCLDFLFIKYTDYILYLKYTDDICRATFVQVLYCEGTISSKALQQSYFWPLPGYHLAMKGSRRTIVWLGEKAERGQLIPVNKRINRFLASIWRITW